MNTNLVKVASKNPRKIILMKYPKGKQLDGFITMSYREINIYAYLIIM